MVVRIADARLWIRGGRDSDATSTSWEPRPRLFRLIRDQAILNRMGFNNGGLEAMVKRLEQRPAGLVVGGNISKNKDTPNDQATEDYLLCIDALHAHVDYFVVNVSSPNTPGLRELQEKGPISIATCSG